jgi:hypothetical protein
VLDPLAVPTNLQGRSEPGGTAVDLTWTNNAVGDTAYAVLMSTGPFGPGSLITQQTIAADSTAYTWTGLTAGQLYYFEVCSVSAGTLSPPSNMISVSTDVPQPPSNLVASPVSSTEIDLLWTASVSAGVTGYRIEWSTDMGTTWATLTNVPASPTTYKDTGLSQSLEYCYRVFASNANGDSFPTPMACAIPMSIWTAVYPASTDFGLYSTIAVTPAGAEKVAHYDQHNFHLLYTDGRGPSSTHAIDTSANNTGYSANGLDLDSSGIPNLSYISLPPSGSAWGSYTTIPGAPAVIDSGAVLAGQSSKLRIAPGGTIHVVFYDELAGYNAYRYAMRVGTTWTLTQVTAISEMTIQNSARYLDLDSTGNPSFMYTHRLNAGLPTQRDEIVWARYSSGSWTTTVVPNQSQPYSFPTFAFDASNNPHVVYVASTGLGHATNASGVWTFELIVPSLSGVNDECPSIAINKNSGRIHVAYGSGGLKYARKDPGGAWVLRTLDATGDVGHFPSIAVDGSGAIHVSYRDNTAKTLKIASGTP